MFDDANQPDEDFRLSDKREDGQESAAQDDRHRVKQLLWGKRRSTRRPTRSLPKPSSIKHQPHVTRC